MFSPSQRAVHCIMRTSDISYFEHSHQGMWLIMDFLECWEKFCLKNPFSPNLADCGRKNVINVRSPLLFSVTRNLPEGLLLFCSPRDHHHAASTEKMPPGCPTRAWGHRAGSVLTPQPWSLTGSREERNRTGAEPLVLAYWLNTIY